MAVKSDRNTSPALDYHRRNPPGKWAIRPTKPCATAADFALAYTPGVALVSMAIHDRSDAVWELTNRGNTVAVITNGTAVLGLGNIGPLAAKPVMEGKALLFKLLADIDAVDIEVASVDAADLVEAAWAISPGFGGINLAAISAPACFQVERSLRGKLDIPVFHDDQHGTAVVVAAALISALEIAGKSLHDIRVVVNGAGAAGIAIAKFLWHLGVAKEQITVCDRAGVIVRGRERNMNAHKREVAVVTAARTLADALRDADAFIGVSSAGILRPEMVQSMAKDPIVFALASPDPEITYETARATRPDVIVATSQSGVPNQMNNALVFPYVFRAALDLRVTRISMRMLEATARSLALLASEDSRFGPERLIPLPLDPVLLRRVPVAIAAAAIEDGFARRLVDVYDYASQLRRRQLAMQLRQP